MAAAAMAAGSRETDGLVAGQQAVVALAEVALVVAAPVEADRGVAEMELVE